MPAEYEKLKKAAQFLKTTFGPPPPVAIVLGSGLSSFTKALQNKKILSSDRLPGGKKSTVDGHQGEFVAGKCQNVPIIVQAGRLHGYEGHSPAQAVFNVRTLRLWGVKKFIITNASGSLHLQYPPGSMVLIKDHINMTGQNPLVGLELLGGPRFPDMSDAYSESWRKQALQIAKQLKIPKIKEGIYVGTLGPSFETPTEIKMFQKWGGHVVGMSTVWEVIALNQLGAKILGISCAANYGTGISRNLLSHQEVLETMRRIEKDFIRFLEGIIVNLNKIK